MKQIIVMVAMIVLGVMIFNLIAGDGDDSVLSLLKNVWGSELSARTRFP